MQINRGMMASAAKYMGLYDIASSARYLSAGISRGLGNTISMSGLGTASKRAAVSNPFRRAATRLGFGMRNSSEGYLRSSLGSARGFFGAGTNMPLSQRAARIGMLGGGYMGYRSMRNRRRR